MSDHPTESSETSATPPPALSDELALQLEALDAAELRAVITYAQSLLPTEPASADLIDERPEEEILDITEHEGYTTVIKAQPCVDGCDDCPHGPYLYRVRAEIHPGDEEPTLHWDFLGRVTSTDESINSA